MMKEERYDRCREKLLALLDGERDTIVKMGTVVAVLHHEFESFYWTGFYRNVANHLVVGPYQGTPACTRIAMGSGVCGTAAASRETQVVENVEDFPGHIACDPASVSEIVLPVICSDSGELIAVLDIDSTQAGNFDSVDADCLQQILNLLF